MSFWFWRKDRHGRRYFIGVSDPFVILFIVVALLGALAALVLQAIR